MDDSFTRNAVVAVASKQISWEWVFIHMKVVKRVALEYNPMVAILYDELKKLGLAGLQRMKQVLFCWTR